MSGRTVKATRRDIRRAFGADAVATVAALDTRLRQAEAEIVALKIENVRLQNELSFHRKSVYELFRGHNHDLISA